MVGINVSLWAGFTGDVAVRLRAKAYAAPALGLLPVLLSRAGQYPRDGKAKYTPLAGHARSVCRTRRLMT